MVGSGAAFDEVLLTEFLGDVSFWYDLAPAAPSQAGVCSGRVSSSSSSFARRSQTFTTLQSIAMGEVSTKVIVTSSVRAGQFLQQLCDDVDNTDSKFAP